VTIEKNKAMVMRFWDLMMHGNAATAQEFLVSDFRYFSNRDMPVTSALTSGAIAAGSRYSSNR
jgi:hypothetical protein